MTASVFEIFTDSAEQLLFTLLHRTAGELVAAGAPVAARLEAQAKREAPWTDRTGLARATMQGVNEVNRYGDKYSIGIRGRMSYSPALENMQGMRYSVLRPVMRKNYEGLYDEICAVLGRMEGLD